MRCWFLCRVLCIALFLFDCFFLCYVKGFRAVAMFVWLLWVSTVLFVLRVSCPCSCFCVFEVLRRCLVCLMALMCFLCVVCVAAVLRLRWASAVVCLVWLLSELLFLVCGMIAWFCFKTACCDHACVNVFCVLCVCGCCEFPLACICLVCLFFFQCCCFWRAVVIALVCVCLAVFVYVCVS